MPAVAIVDRQRPRQAQSLSHSSRRCSGTRQHRRLLLPCAPGPRLKPAPRRDPTTGRPEAGAGLGAPERPADPTVSGQGEPRCAPADTAAADRGPSAATGERATHELPAQHPGAERTGAQGASPRQQVWLDSAAPLRAECPLPPRAARLQPSATDGTVKGTQEVPACAQRCPSPARCPPTPWRAQPAQTGPGPDQYNQARPTGGRQTATQPPRRQAEQGRGHTVAQGAVGGRGKTASVCSLKAQSTR